MIMIYVPDLENYKCFVVQSEGVIRAYEEVPKNNQTINYRDYYINSSYIYRDSNQTFSQYSSLPTCLSSSVLTNDFQHRIDYPDILIIFVVYSFFGLYLPFKLIMKLFKKGSV